MVADCAKIDPGGAAYAVDKNALAFLRQWFVSGFSGKKADRDKHDAMFKAYCERLGITKLDPQNIPEK